MKRCAAATGGKAAKAQRTESDTSETGSIPQTIKTSVFDRGLSLRGLRKLAATAAGQSIRACWRSAWLFETVAPGWTIEVQYSNNNKVTGRWEKIVYTNSATGERRQCYSPDLDASDLDESIAFGAPPGCMSLWEARADISCDIGRPTHLLSFPWSMSFPDMVEAAAAALDESTECFFWVDLVVNNFHHNLGTPTSTRTAAVHVDINAYNNCGILNQSELADGASYLSSYRDAMHGLGLVQVCSRWNDPERTKRLWMMVETSVRFRSFARL